MLIGYKDKTELELVGHGSGGLNELKQHLSSDKVMANYLLSYWRVYVWGILRLLEGSWRYWRQQILSGKRERSAFNELHY